MTAHDVDAQAIGAAVAAVRRRGPLVQCLTNIVVANWTANVLLAAGLAPAMVDNPEEAPGFAGVADGVLVNLGTPYAETVEAMRRAARAARGAATPWVLDPVAVGGLAWRTEVALELVALGPAIVRGNASEVLALAGGSGGRGVDATDTADGAAATAASLADRFGTVVAVSGEVDLLTDGTRVVRIANGHPLLTRVTGVGCSLGALMAGFAGAVDDRLLAAAGATALLTVAADRAAHRTGRPGSFAVALLDELDALAPEDVAAAVRLP